MPLRNDVQGLRVWLACDWFVKYTAGLARGLADIDCEVVFLTRDHDREFGGDSGAMRAFVAQALGEEAQHLELAGRVRSPSSIGELIRLRSACKRWSADVVHVQDSLANDVRLAFASGLTSGRYALTIHDPVLHPGDATPSRGIRILRRVLRQRAGLVFVHSRALAEELVATGDVHAPIEVVPHGAGEAELAPFPTRVSLLFFGRISYYKGLDVLFDAMPFVWERRPDVTLTVAGEGEVPAHHVLSDSRITLRSEHVPEDELPALLADSTCVVLPYRQASQSGVGSLAKQHGRAIVATKVGGLPELVAEGWGRLVPAEDPRALADGIVEVVDTPGLAEEMGRSAAAASEDASWRSVAAMTIQAYRRHLL